MPPGISPSRSLLKIDQPGNRSIGEKQDGIIFIDPILSADITSIKPYADLNRMHWWTRSPRIRTLGEIDFKVNLLDANEMPQYQKIAKEAFHMHRLGMSKRAIARHLEVDLKTVRKAISLWLRQD